MDEVWSEFKPWIAHGRPRDIAVVVIFPAGRFVTAPGWCSCSALILPVELMTPELTSLREKIEAFPLDESSAALPFTSRLAREQGWDHAFAGRVAGEYLRFIYLAMVAGHPVTPSEQVDQAWHLHLIYTRSYWEKLCRDTLGRDLHHGPTVGGSDEDAKFVDWYEKTLASYRRIFNEPPPADIWPDPAARFCNAGAGRWIDRTKFWLIPRPRWARRGFWKKPHPHSS